MTVIVCLPDGQALRFTGMEVHGILSIPAMLIMLAEAVIGCISTKTW